MKKLLMCAVTMLLVLCLTAGPASAARAAGSAGGVPPLSAGAVPRLAGEEGDPDEEGDPGAPDDSYDPDESGDPDEPGDTGDPEEPEEPEEPGGPVEPDVPEEPGNPGEPEEPGNPGEPEEPDNPEEPEEPDVPDKPDEPSQPEEPDTPDASDEPDIPEVPGGEPPQEPEPPHAPMFPEEEEVLPPPRPTVPAPAQPESEEGQTEGKAEGFTGDAGNPGIAGSGVPLPEFPLTDVSEEDSFAAAVREVRRRGLMSDTGGGRFTPYGRLSRAMAAQILYNLAGRPAASAEAAFTDTPPESWFTPAVAWCARTKLIGGYGGGLFGPEDDVTREQMAVMLYRSAAYLGLDVGAAPENAAVPGAAPWAAEAMGWALHAGVVESGDDPAAPLTRAEVAQMLARLCQLLEPEA